MIASGRGQVRPQQASSTAGQTQTTRPPGPLPNLISSLRIDNRDQLIQLLTLDNPAQAGANNVNSNTNSVIVPPQTKQRLVFATESLRSLLLYHVLPDPSTKSPASGILPSTIHKAGTKAKTSLCWLS